MRMILKKPANVLLLNFGHTLGHAVEKLMNFTMPHGECVAVGMHAAAWLSMEKGMLTEAAYKDITDTIASFGLPVSVKGLEPEQIVAVSKSDKKMDKGRVKFILLDPEGHAVIDRSIRDEQLFGGGLCLSSEMENSHEIYKGGNCSFAAGSSGSVDQGAGRKASDEYRRHNIYTESFQIILSGKQRLCFWINAESKKSF